MNGHFKVVWNSALNNTLIYPNLFYWLAAKEQLTITHNVLLSVCLTVNFDHFEILRAIGKGSFGKVRIEMINHQQGYVAQGTESPKMSRLLNYWAHKEWSFRDVFIVGFL